MTNEHDKQAALLPCPFCGSPADDFNPDGGYEGYGIRCSGKFAIFNSDESCCPMHTFGYKRESDAITAWNRRAAVERQDITADYNSASDILAEITGCHDDSVKLWQLADMVRNRLRTAEARAVERQAPECGQCANRGVTLGGSQESACSHCIYGEQWKKDYFKAAPSAPGREG